MKRTLLTALAAVSIAGIASSCGETEMGSQNKSSLQSIASYEDCVGLDYQTAKVRKIGGSYKIVEGPTGSHWAFDFGSKKMEAIKALRVIKKYKIKHSCFVGRPDPSFQYLLSGSENAPLGKLLPNEDCIKFNNKTVKVKYFPGPGSWKMVDGNMWMVDFGNKKAEAYKSLRVVKKHKFNQQCFVGRPDPSFKYWKRTIDFTPNPGPGLVIKKPDLGAYGFLKIGESGGKLVKWNDTIVLKPSDAFLVSNGIPAFNLFYTEKNYGKKLAKGYANRIYLDGKLVSQQVNRPKLLPGQKQPIYTQAYLKASPGVHTLTLKIDDGNLINESREDNNVFKVKIIFQGF